MTPFDGCNVWIWNLGNCSGGNYDAIAKQVLSAGGRGVYVKASDGANWFSQYQATGTAVVPITTIVAELRQRGLVVSTWSYHYGDDIAGEAQRVIETITQAKPDGHLFDVEAEFETQANPAALATQLLQTIQAGIPAGFPLAHAPIGSIRNHLAAPYRQFADAGCYMVPQTYFNAFQWTPQNTLSQFYADAAQYNLLTPSVMPAYGDFVDAASGTQQPSMTDVLAFVQLVQAQQASGISVWSYEHLDAGGWSRFAAAAKAFGAVQPPPKRVMADADVVAALKALLGTSNFDPAAAIAALQPFV